MASGRYESFTFAEWIHMWMDLGHREVCHGWVSFLGHIYFKIPLNIPNITGVVRMLTENCKGVGYQEIERALKWSRPVILTSTFVFCWEFCRPTTTTHILGSLLSYFTNLVSVMSPPGITSCQSSSGSVCCQLPLRSQPESLHIHEQQDPRWPLTEL